ncbi:Phosphoribosyl-AMP cyclohydrolase [Pseudovibrio axinellae]|uniref:Phosphoribosyl-AMP cyclohydrolase n=1 Tax=Pseudovibrio axinellae TaxID=989403 RepID=A0A166AKR1_9HYPH|nr:phosphoribosyl-AMP cyclohydrolase [Pseudovibrio axinellae]KZL21245.1 Phosphoribosyl-AMP cyclohydrolase [Pseudovibrio axinellae]SEQ93327.1 phosphoribosyl-AMP cyclohydrolase [Pseudovibrio axinellae]
MSTNIKAGGFAPRADKNTVELGDELRPKFDENGLIVAAVTDFESGELVMVGYMNAESLRRTIETGEAWYWSRSRQEYWKKGGTSGQVQEVIELRTDCDQDAIWLRVKVHGNGATCHVGYRSCFFRTVKSDDTGEVWLEKSEASPTYDPQEVYGENQ